MDGYTRAASGKRLSKHAPIARQLILIMKQLDYNNRKAIVFYMVHAERFVVEMRFEA
jgi:hypothetical protein